MAYKSEEFALAYKGVNGLQKAPCLGYAVGGGWAMTGEGGKGWSLFTGGKVVELDFLFVVPKEVGEVTVQYKGQPAGKTLNLGKE